MKILEFSNSYRSVGELSPSSSIEMGYSPKSSPKSSPKPSPKPPRHKQDNDSDLHKSVLNVSLRYDNQHEKEKRKSKTFSFHYALISLSNLRDKNTLTFVGELPRIRSSKLRMSKWYKFSLTNLELHM